MKNILSLFLICFGFLQTTWAADSYNSQNGQLSIPFVRANGVIYKDVVVQLGDVLAVYGGVAADYIDSYDPRNNKLTIPTVNAYGNTYNNVVVAVNRVISVGGIDSSSLEWSASFLAKPAAIPDDKLRLTRIDYRYDTPNDEYDVNGYQTTSFESIKIMVDRIKAVGFNGVILQLQTPINSKTGLVSFIDSPGVNKILPKDYLKVVQYIKSQNLKLWLSLQIVDSVTDVEMKYDFTKYSEDTMFKSISAYQKSIAVDAEANKIDGIIVSEGNWLLEGDEHGIYWRGLIEQIRSVYYGKISYTTFSLNRASPWNYVDKIGILIRQPLSNTSVYDLSNVVDLYKKSIYDGNLIDKLKSINSTYNKDLIIFQSPVAADMGINVDPPGFWDMVITNAWNTETYNKIKPYVNYETQKIKIASNFEIVARYLSNITGGIVIDGYAPWVNNIKFSNPANSVYLYYCCSSNFNANIEAEKAINLYLSKPWGYSSLN